MISAGPVVVIPTKFPNHARGVAHSSHRAETRRSQFHRFTQHCHPNASRNSSLHTFSTHLQMV
jgi:hypothetical protein